MDLLRKIADRIGEIIGDDTGCQSLNDFLMLGLKLIDFCEMDEYEVDFSLQERLSLALELFCYTKIEAIQLGSDKDMVQASLLISRVMRLYGNINDAFSELKNVLDLDDLEVELRNNIVKEIQSFDWEHESSRNYHELVLEYWESDRNQNEIIYIKRRIDFNDKVEKEIKKYI